MLQESWFGAVRLYPPCRRNMRILLNKWTHLCPLGLCFLLGFHAVPAVLRAQTLPTEINLVVIEGEGAINNLHQRAARDPIVQVEDENHRPVAGAAVTFTLPTSGTSGEFSNGSKTLTIISDSSGQAVAKGLKTNQVGGKLQIYVTASYRGLRARTLINQFNGSPGSSGEGAKAAHSGGGGGKIVAILAIVGAAAAGGVIAATHKSGGSSSGSGSPAPTIPTPIGITPGSGTISAPH